MRPRTARTRRGLAAALLALAAAGCGGGSFAGADADADADADSSPDADGDGGSPERLSGPSCLFVDEEQGRALRATGEDFFAPYLAEILGHAGVPFVVVGRAELARNALPCPVLVLAHDSSTSDAERAALESYLRRGGLLVAIGGASGLEDLLGLEAALPRSEGFLEALDAEGPPLPLPPRPLHVFGGAGARATTATPLARWLDEAGEATDLVALARRGVGDGEAWFVGPDLAHSVVTIQQGRPVHEDGAPAPDGTAALDDGILKTDDGVVLDWVLDRDLVDGEPLFLEPVADLLRELLLALVLRGHTRAGNPMPMLWYWPGELDAVGVLSHDSDGNDPALARALLDEVTALGLESTWCFMRDPETLPAELFAEVAAAGGEIALHFDARTGTADTVWTEASFQSQLAWLLELSGATVSTNKNHYLRWEGWAELYRWLERAGLEADQSRGPSKRGNVGFLFGTCHPFFPVDDAEHDNRTLDVLAVSLLTQDLVHTCAYAVGPALVDRAAARFGVAHFLFHPAHVRRDGVAEAMRDVVAYGRSLGLEWWTVARLNDWERARRRVAFSGQDAGGFEVETPAPLAGATLLVLLGSADDRPEIRVGGSPVDWEPFAVYGARTARLTLDLPAGSTRITVSRRD